MNKHELIINGNDFIGNKVILPFYVDSVINVYSGRYFVYNVYNYYYNVDKKILDLLSERSDVSDVKVIFTSKQLDRDEKINKILNE